MQFPGRLLDVIIVGMSLHTILFFELAQLRSRLNGRLVPSPFLSVESENNFPTSAGMASSASGTAAFGMCIQYFHTFSICFRKDVWFGWRLHFPFSAWLWIIMPELTRRVCAVV